MVLSIKKSFSKNRATPPITLGSILCCSTNFMDFSFEANAAFTDTARARAEELDRTYVGDVLRLTLLAPEIVEAIVEGRQPEGVTLPLLMKPFPVEWHR